MGWLGSHLDGYRKILRIVDHAMLWTSVFSVTLNVCPLLLFLPFLSLEQFPLGRIKRTVPDPRLLG